MRWMVFWAGLLMGGGLASAETPLYWALANNDALAVWQATAADGNPVDVDGAPFDRAVVAVSHGSAEALSALIWKGVSLEGIDGAGQNLLFPAAALGRLDLFETIQAGGAKVDQVDFRGRTLLHAAALSPHPEMLHTLLALGLGPRDPSALGVTPLMEACRAGRADEAQVLLAWGSIPEDEDYLGRSVRDYAVASQDPATLAVLDEALTPWTIEPDGEVPLP